MIEVEMFQTYLSKERNLSKRTVSSYLGDLTQFFEFTCRKIVNVKPDDISGFIVHLRAAGYSVSSTNRKLSALKSFFKYMMKKGIISANPADLVEGGRAEQRLPKPIDMDDIDRMIECTDNIRDRTLLEILYGTGMRRFEVANIRIQDINFRSGYIRVFGKGGKERIVPIHPAALGLIEELSKHRGKWLFMGRGDKNISLRQINEIVKNIAKKAGVANATPHKFRHSFCTHLYSEGAELKVIQDLAGHSSPATTQLYTKVNNARNRLEYLRYHPRAK